MEEGGWKEWKDGWKGMDLPWKEWKEGRQAGGRHATRRMHTPDLGLKRTRRSGARR